MPKTVSLNTDSEKAIDMHKLGRAIRCRRNKLGLTLTAMAYDLGISRALLSRIETGGTASASFLLIDAIAVYLRTDLCDFIASVRNNTYMFAPRGDLLAKDPVLLAAPKGVVANEGLVEAQEAAMGKRREI